ncbi:B-cell lymphoma 3 protein [Pelodytes ibericus]
METSTPLDLSTRSSIVMYEPMSSLTNWSGGDQRGSTSVNKRSSEGVILSEEGQNGSMEEPEPRKDQTCLPLRKRRYPPSPKDERPMVKNMDDYKAWEKRCYIPPNMAAPLPYYYQGSPIPFLPPPYSIPASAMMTTQLVGPTRYTPAEIQLQADIDVATKPDEDGDTALHIAVVHGNILAVKRLICLLSHAGKTLDCLNNLRQTPLHLAVITDQPALVCLLCENGCSPQIPDRNGQTCIHLACEYESIRSLEVLLRGSAGDLDATNYQGMTALHVAINVGHQDTALCLLDNGADVDAVEVKSGRSPLIQAVENGCEELVSLLLRRGGKVNAQTYAGNTALHVASGRGLEEIARILLKSGADSGIKNCHNDTSITVAKNRRMADILRGKSSSPRAQHERPKGEICESSVTPPPQAATSRHISVSPPP